MSSAILKVIESLNQPVGKRTRLSNPVIFVSDEKDENYISATEFENFCENDLISDWFSVISKKIMIDKPEHSDSLKFLFEKGVKHEDNIIDKLREITKLPLGKHTSVKTSREYDTVNKLIEKKDYDKVISSIKNGDPIIYSGYICDKKEKLRGIPDLLVRNDYIHTIFPDLNESIKEDFDKHNLENKVDYHYVPVEIKFSTVELSSGNKYILNKGRMKIYKTQLYVYCKILQEIQGVFPRYTFIIGKRTVTHNNTIKDSIQHPGTIDYYKYDNEYIKIFMNGLKWLRDVKKNGLSWSINDIYKKHIFPNMKSNNTLYLKDKKELSEKYGEITELWRCSIFHRNNALEQGIYSWRDERFNSDIACMSKSYKNSLDNILKVNREDFDYFPLSFSDKDFRNIENEMFVDFELLRDSFDTESYGDTEYIFLIGIRYKGQYKPFMMNFLDISEEKRVMDEFYNFVLDNGNPKCWYWCAEVKFWNKAILRHSDNPDSEKYKNIKWVDLYDLYTKESFAVKGSMNFKLKSYIKNLVKLNKIDVELPPENCSDGLSAMTIAWNYYTSSTSSNQNNESNELTQDMKDVLYYNSLDCQYVEELLKFARNNL
jgi:hypothetical protein